VLGLSVSEQRIDTSTVLEALQAIDRCTVAYTSALTLVSLLLQSKGIALEGRHTTLPLPGFLFDMNRFFQALISCFLREHLSGYSIKDEPRLRGMFAYDPAHNPRHLPNPIQKPDFVVAQGTTVAAVIDAKYRDLWQHSLPPDMLYQLALYALGPAGATKRSVILYPTLDSEATDQVIAIQEPIYGTSKAYVTVRPVNLIALDDLLNAPASQSTRRKRAEMAQHLVFGRRS
jgi:5-methylcytosine-specific restriction enzyme subunit McrC